MSFDAGTVYISPVAPPARGYAATSSSSVVIGVGSKSFTVGTAFAFVVNDRIRATAVASGAWMEGVVTSYSGSTLTIDVNLTYGSGTFTSWILNLSGEPGIAPITPGAVVNAKLVEAHVANATTFNLKTLGGTDPSPGYPVTALFSDGAVRRVTSSLSLTLPATTVLMGTVNNTPFRLWFLLIDHSGTMRLGAFQSRTATDNFVKTLPPNGILPVGAIGSGIAGFVYIGDIPVVVPCPYVVIGMAEYDSGLPTAGQWSASPTRIGLSGPGVKLPGHEIQNIGYQDGAVASSAATTDIDDSIPQITEGAQFMAQAITPKSPMSVIDIEAQAWMFNNDALFLIAALHKIGVADALASVFTGGNNNHAESLRLRTRVFLGSTAAATFTYRCGRQPIGAGNAIFFNGQTTVGGVASSYMRLTERMT